MRNMRMRFLTLAVLWIGSHAAFAETHTSTVRLAEGTPHETMAFVQTADRPGPTVVVSVGWNEDEHGAAQALDVVRYWPIERGTLVVLPRIDLRGLVSAAQAATPRSTHPLRLRSTAAHLRPAAPEPHSVPSNPLAAAVWSLERQFHPDWLVIAHEGDELQPSAGGRGVNVVACDSDATTRALVASAGAHSTHDTFSPADLPPSAQVADQTLLAPPRVLIVQTDPERERVPARARSQRRFLHALLSRLQMLEPSVTSESLVTRLTDPELLQVGLFEDLGVSGHSHPRIEQQLRSRADVRLLSVDADDIRSGACDRFDALLFTGGRGSRQGHVLGEPGRRKVREFVERGGTYLGICAGAYLASGGTSDRLGLLNAVPASNHWQRGNGDVMVELTPAGQALFGVDQHTERAIHYANGPVWKLTHHAGLGTPEVLAWFRTELAQHHAPRGIMVNSPAMLRGRFGQGTVYAFSCHPEVTAGCEQFVLRTILTAREKHPAVATAGQ